MLQRPRRRRAMCVMIAVVGGWSAVPLARAAKPAPRTGAELFTLIQAQKGAPLVLRNVTIEDDVDLTGLRVVEGTFACRSCRIEGDLVGSNVVFRGALDLSGLELGGAARFHAAVFEGPTLFGEEFEGAGATFERRADFSLASFGDFVSFQGATFTRAADFRLARFRGESVFATTTFSGDASFDGAVFGGGARFDVASFDGPASFSRSIFRDRADFRDAAFAKDAFFDGARFTRSGDFAQTTFDRQGGFVQASFVEGASFVGAKFGALFKGKEPDPAAYFERASSGGSLDFSEATFGGDADFNEVTSVGLSFRDATFAGDPADPSAPKRNTGSVTMQGLTAADLVLAVDDVDRLDVTDRERTLELIESSAKERGDIGLANDAHYRLHVLTSRHHGWLRRTADLIFYRGLAGYFVRPLHPLVAALALGLVLALWREFRPRRTWPGRLRRFGAWCCARGGPVARLVARLFDSAAAVRRGGKAEAPDAGALGRRFEVLAYRVLIVCALIGLANSNPTLRQMFDALL